MIPYGYVYRIRNKINGNTYVGQRKLARDKSWRHYMGSGSAIKAAIKKYGKENFTKEFLAYAYSSLELSDMETEAIHLERENNNSVYNLCNITSAAFSRMTDEEIALNIGQRIERFQATHRSNFEIFANRFGEDVQKLYPELRSCEKVAKTLNVSRLYVTRYLKEAGVTLNHRTISGVKASEETKSKISEALRKKNEGLERKSRITLEPRIKLPSTKRNLKLICAYCDEFFIGRNVKSKFCSSTHFAEFKKKQSLMNLEEVKRLYFDENMTLEKIGEIYSVSGSTVGKFMDRNNIIRKKRKSRLAV